MILEVFNLFIFVCTGVCTSLDRILMDFFNEWQLEQSEFESPIQRENKNLK
jgi:hypothetical protein